MTVWLAMAVATLAGCSLPVNRVPATMAEAMRHNRKGVEASVRGEYEEALLELAEARRLHASVENGDGVVVAEINMARTNRLRGDLRGAAEHVEGAFPSLTADSDLAAELYFEKAKVLLASGELAGAREWAERSAGADRGGSVGQRNNLLARILFLQGEHDRAARLVLTALEQNRGRGDREEEANGLRLQGDISLARGESRTAAERFMAALAVDKELGISRKISADLVGMGKARAAAGELDAAIDLYRRAEAVSLNGSDYPTAMEIMGRLADLYRKKGDEENAGRIEEKRKSLPQGRARTPAGGDVDPP